MVGMHKSNALEQTLPSSQGGTARRKGGNFPLLARVRSHVHGLSRGFFIVAGATFLGIFVALVWLGIEFVFLAPDTKGLPVISRVPFPMRMAVKPRQKKENWRVYDQLVPEDRAERDHMIAAQAPEVPQGTEYRSVRPSAEQSKRVNSVRRLTRRRIPTKQEWRKIHKEDQKKVKSIESLLENLKRANRVHRR